MLAFESDAGFDQLVEGGDRLVQSRVRADVADESIQYHAAYSLHSGVLARSMAADGDQASELPSELGRQSFVQALSLALPESFGVPFSLDIHNQYEFRWSLAGEHRTESSRAHLHWKPKYLGLDLHWTPPRELAVPGQPLDCHTRANLHLPDLTLASGLGAAIDLSQDHCQVLAPARGVDGFDVEAQAVAWRWGENLNHSLSMRRLRPYRQAQLPVISEPAWELGFAHRQSLVGWELGMSMAWRQFAKQTERADYKVPSNWVMDLMLKREFGLVALTARWLHASDPLWFVPLASPVERERVSLLVDFSRWLIRQWPAAEASMSASFDHVEDARGVEDNHVKWNLYLSW